MNMQQMKAQYEKLEHLHPQKKITDLYRGGVEDDKTDAIVSSLLNKSRGGGFQM